MRSSAALQRVDKREEAPKGLGGVDPLGDDSGAMHSAIDVCIGPLPQDPHRRAVVELQRQLLALPQHVELLAAKRMVWPNDRHALRRISKNVLSM